MFLSSCFCRLLWVCLDLHMWTLFFKFFVFIEIEKNIILSRDARSLGLSLLAGPSYGENEHLEFMRDVKTSFSFFNYVLVKSHAYVTLFAGEEDVRAGMFHRFFFHSCLLARSCVLFVLFACFFFVVLWCLWFWVLAMVTSHNSNMPHYRRDERIMG